MDASTATSAQSATTTTVPSSSSPSFYVTTAERKTSTKVSSVDLAPGTAGVAVPAMARRVPAPPPASTTRRTPTTFEGLMMEALRDL